MERTLTQFTFVGDPHSHFTSLKYLCSTKPDRKYVLLGDVCIVGDSPKYQFFKSEVLGRYDVTFIRGNHDNPEMCKSYAEFIDDGTFQTLDSGTKICYIGGASSIDRVYGERKQGLDWWQDEQLTFDELRLIKDKIGIEKPDVIVSHTFPAKVCEQLFGVGTYRMPWMSDALLGNDDPLNPSGMGCEYHIVPRTETVFQEIFEVHQPDLWVGGHWHVNRSEKIGKTLFRCIDIMNFMEIEL